MNHSAVGAEAIFIERSETVAVDQQEVRFRVKPPDRALHSGNGCPKNFQLIYFLSADSLDRPSDRLTLNDRPQDIPGFLAHLLGIVQQRVVEIRRKYHGRGIDRASQRTAPGLVTAGLDAPRLHKRQQMYLFLYIHKFKPCRRTIPFGR